MNARHRRRWLALVLGLLLAAGPIVHSCDTFSGFASYYLMPGILGVISAVTGAGLCLHALMRRAAWRKAQKEETNTPEPKP